MPPHYAEQRQQHNPRQLKCTMLNCSRWFKNVSGRTKHIRSHHDAQAAMRPRLRRRRQPSPPAVPFDDTPQIGGVRPSSPQPSHSPCPLPGDLRFSPLVDMGALSGGTPTRSSRDRDYPEQDIQSPSPRNSPMLQQFSGSPPLVQDLPRFSHHSHSHLSNPLSESTSNRFLASISHPLINGEFISPTHIQAYLKPH